MTKAVKRQHQAGRGAYPSRHARGYGGGWDRLRKRILRRDGGLCQHCKERGLFRGATDVDHVTPKKQGGTDDPDNLQSLCRACHKDKTRAENASTGKQTISGCNTSGTPIDPSHHWNA